MHPPRTSGRPPRAPRAVLHPLVAHEPVPTRERLSAAALKLHVLGVLVSIYEQHPGLVTHAYIAGIRDDTDLPILDLCCAGLWDYTEHGYVVPAHEVARIARIVHEQVNHDRDGR